MQDQLSFQPDNTAIQNVKGKIDISSTSIQDTITNTNQYTTNPLLLTKPNRYATHTNVCHVFALYLIQGCQTVPTVYN